MTTLIDVSLDGRLSGSGHGVRRRCRGLVLVSVCWSHGEDASTIAMITSPVQPSVARRSPTISTARRVVAMAGSVRVTGVAVLAGTLVRPYPSAHAGYSHGGGQGCRRAGLSRSMSRRRKIIQCRSIGQAREAGDDHVVGVRAEPLGGFAVDDGVNVGESGSVEGVD